MKMVASVSLALALALGTAGVMMPSAALAAKKEKAPAAKAPELSKEFRAAIGAAQGAAQKKDIPGLQAALGASAPLAKGPDELFYQGQLSYELARLQNDQAGMVKAIDAMIDSRSMLPTNMAQLNMASGQGAYQAGDFNKAIARMAEADRLGSKEVNRLLLSAEAHFKLNQFAQGLPFIARAMDETAAAGQPVPEDWVRRGVSVALRSKDAGLISTWSHKLVRNAPSKTNWRDALIIYRDSAKLDAKSQLDVARLMFDTNSLAGERDYNDYAALALEGKLPWEALAVSSAGLSNGAVPATSKAVKDRQAEAKAMVPAETAAIAADAKRAATGGTATYATNVGNALIAQGDNAKALELLATASGRPGADMAAINMLQGIALTRLGRKDEAKASFAKVTTGPKAEIAKFWLLYLELGAPAA